MRVYERDRLYGERGREREGEDGSVCEREKVGDARESERESRW